jgi:NADPH2:quinone reductase
MDWYQEGKLKPHISQTYPLAQAGEALNTLMQRQATGRIVVTTR